MLVQRKLAHLRERSDEDYDVVTGEMSIETYNAAKDGFRVAPGDRIPVPWPYDQVSRSQRGPSDLTQHFPTCHEVAKKYGITLHYTQVFSIAPRYLPRDSKDTLVLSTPDEDPSKWKDAATELYERILRTNPGFSFRVEIRNSRRMYRDVSFAIKAGTDVQKKLLERLDKIIVAVRAFIPEWTSVYFRYRGDRDSQEEDRRVSLIITVLPGAKRNWIQAERDLTNSIPHLAPSIDFQLYLEIIPTVIETSVFTSDLHPPSQAYIDLPYVPQSGASIGPRGSDNAGTLGIWVHFQAKGEIKKQECFLTCYHVVAPGDPGNRTINDQLGIGLDGRKALKTIQIDYPAPVDAEATRNVLRKRISENQDVARYQKVLNTIDKHFADGGLGYVLHASGIRRTSRNSRLDWAIVALNDKSAFGKNVPPGHERLDHLELLYLKGNYEVALGEQVTKVGTVGKNYWVISESRTTERTVGEVNSIDTIFPLNSDTSYHEMAISGVVGGKAFAKPGDSGAMVSDSDKELIGMVFAAQVTDEVAFVTPWQDIFDDVKAMTGGTLSLPQ